MLHKTLVLCAAIFAATFLLSTNVLAWGCGGWSRSGSATFTGRYGNTYSANWSCSGGFGGGGWNRYGYDAVTGQFLALYLGIAFRNLTLAAYLSQAALGYRKLAD